MKIEDIDSKIKSIEASIGIDINRSNALNSQINMMQKQLSELNSKIIFSDGKLAQLKELKEELDKEV